jgi:choline dehydrogenase-like flavoprotein
VRIAWLPPAEPAGPAVGIYQSLTQHPEQTRRVWPARRQMTDVVVIGSGPVGASAARRLAERGCRTALLDAGRPVPLPDLPTARAGEHLRNRPAAQRAPETFIAEAMSRCAFYDSAAAREGLPGACETVAFGGQSLVWTNNCPRTQSGFDRWPALNDATWERRYAEAEAMLDVGIDRLGPSERQRRVAARVATHLAGTAPAGRRVTPLPLAGRADGRGGICFTATADILAGSGTDGERVRVHCGARATALEHAHGRVAAVRIATEQGEERLPADAVVVAAGVFGTPRLLFASGIAPAALGRWLHYHPLLLGQLVLDDALVPPPGTLDVPPRLYIPPTRAAPWHAMILRDVGAGIPREAIAERVLLELQFFAPIEPRPEHRMTLDGPRPRFTVHLSPADETTLAAMRADLMAIGAVLGRWRGGCEPDWNPWGLSHPMGTTRMGDDPATSVVDRHGRVHGFDNLYVVGASVIPVPIAVNPTLTAVALALEAADSLIGDRDWYPTRQSPSTNH